MPPTDKRVPRILDRIGIAGIPTPQDKVWDNCYSIDKDDFADLKATALASLSAASPIKALAERCRPAVAHDARLREREVSSEKYAAHYKPVLKAEAEKAGKLLDDIDAILAGAPTSSARSQEPIAWAEYDREGQLIGVTHVKPDGFWPNKPLYLAPDSATLPTKDDDKLGMDTRRGGD